MSPALRAGFVAFVVVLVGGGSAQAGKPGKWTVATPAFSNIVEVGMARLPDGTLNVLWTTDKQVMNSQIAADGTVTGPFPVFAYTGGVNSSVALAAHPVAGLRAF